MLRLNPKLDCGKKLIKLLHYLEDNVWLFCCAGLGFLSIFFIDSKAISRPTVPT